MRRHLLVTRPEPGLSQTMAAVASLGFMPVACPTLTIRQLAPRLPCAEALAAILLTSGQAVPPLAQTARTRDPALCALPVFAVGDNTAARALSAGFANTLSAGGDAQDLAALVEKMLPAAFRRAGSLPLLLATGAGHGQTLTRLLRGRGARLHRRTVYEARPVRRLPAAFFKALRSDQVTACLFFSADAARNFVRLCPVALHPALTSVHALAISPAAGAVAGELPWASVRTAERPDAAAMLALLPLRTHFLGARDELLSQC